MKAPGSSGMPKPTLKSVGPNANYWHGFVKDIIAKIFMIPGNPLSHSGAASPGLGGLGSLPYQTGLASRGHPSDAASSAGIRSVLSRVRR